MSESQSQKDNENQSAVGRRDVDSDLGAAGGHGSQDRFSLAIVIAGMFLADGQRTASAWFVAAGVQDDWDRFYDCLISLGRTSGKRATAVLGLLVQKFAPTPGGRILLAMGDSRTSRYGRHVEGAGVHHNPTPGPAGGEWLYGRNGGTLAWLATHPLWGVIAIAWLATHPLWGVIAIPPRSMLYVREVDVPKLAEKHGVWEFRTKHQLGVELLTWFVPSLRALSVWPKDTSMTPENLTYPCGFLS